MIYQSIYKNGKPDYFFLRAENPAETGDACSAASYVY